jgi:hypothetical protein
MLVINNMCYGPTVLHQRASVELKRSTESLTEGYRHPCRQWTEYDSVWHWDSCLFEYCGLLLSLLFEQCNLTTLHADTTDGKQTWQLTVSLNKILEKS